MKTQLSSLFLPILWVAGFICALYPINALQLELFGAAVALIFLWSFLIFGKGLKTGWEIPRSPVLLIAGLFFLLVFASVFWSEIKPISLMGVCFFSVMPLGFFAGVVNKDENYFRRVALMLVPVFAVMSLWALYQFFFLNSYFYGQARHPLGDPSSLGCLLMLPLFCTLGWIVLDDNKMRRILAVILAVVLCGGIVATVARGPIFAFVPGIVMFLLLLWPKIRERRAQFAAVLLGAGAIIALTYLPFPKQYDIASRVGETIGLSAPDVSNNRMNIWGATVDMIKDAPWVGRGVSTYYMYYPEYRFPTETAGTFHAHNDPLQFWVELGILGPVLFYAFVIAAAIRTFSALNKLSQTQTRERVIIVSVFSALISLVVASHVGFNFYNLSILALTGFLLSVWFYYTGLAVKDDVIMATMPEKSPAIVNMSLLAVPFLMLGGVFLSLIAGEHYVNRARDAMFRGEPFTFAEEINKAGKVSHGMNTRAYTLAVNVPMAIMEDRKKYASKEMQANLYKQVVGYMDAIQRINPRAPEVYYYKARIQQLVDKDIVPEGTAKPEELYAKALQLDPVYLGARMALAGIYAEQKDRKKREDILAGGENFTYNAPLAMEYYQSLATAYLEAGNYVKAKEAMGRALDFKRRSDFSRARVNTSIPQAVQNDGNVIDPAAVPIPDSSFPQIPDQAPETSGKKESGL